MVCMHEKLAGNFLAFDPRDMVNTTEVSKGDDKVIKDVEKATKMIFSHVMIVTPAELSA